ALTKQDIATRTPYNTYRIDGLPPGPIANPGRAALQAVLNPQVTNELYFVADGNGGPVFCENLGDHRQNVAQLRESARQKKKGKGGCRRRTGGRKDRRAKDGAPARAAAGPAEETRAGEFDNPRSTPS